jgi:hypothetical protein
MNLKAGWPVRVVAGVTVAYSTAIAISPRLLAGPCGLLSPDGSVPVAVAQLTRSIGVRDAALAAALGLAPAGYPLRLLAAARVISDGADAVWLSRLVDDRPGQAKIAGVAVGWALLELLTGLTGLRGASGEA